MAREDWIFDFADAVEALDLLQEVNDSVFQLVWNERRKALLSRCRRERAEVPKLHSVDCVDSKLLKAVNQLLADVRELRGRFADLDSRTSRAAGFPLGRVSHPTNDRQYPIDPS